MDHKNKTDLVLQGHVDMAHIAPLSFDGTLWNQTHLSSSSQSGTKICLAEILM